MVGFVSVPLRGIGYETIRSRKIQHLIRQQVSVPLRGFGYETGEPDQEFIRSELGEVSVPLRGIGYETRAHHFRILKLQRASFRPLAGNRL